MVFFWEYFIVFFKFVLRNLLIFVVELIFFKSKKFFCYEVLGSLMNFIVSKIKLII